MPHATVHSSLVAEAWLAWHSMHRSMMWFLGIILNSILMGTLYIVKKSVCVCVCLIAFFVEKLYKFCGNLQMAQLSTTMSQAQRATAFHFFTSNLQNCNHQENFPALGMHYVVLQDTHLFLSFPTVPDPLGCSESLSTSILGRNSFVAHSEKKSADFDLTLQFKFYCIFGFASIHIR